MKINEKLLKKIAKKGSAFVLAGTLLLGSNVVTLNDNNVVYAAEQEQIETVNLNVQTGINLYLDDKGFIPTDANGNQAYPFISEGTTYIPIRAIAQLFNAEVIWDSQNKIATITTNSQNTNLENTILKRQEKVYTNINASKGAKLVINGKECIPKDANGNVKDIYVVNGTTYVPVRAVSEALNLPITWSSATNSVFIGKHKNYGLTVENINDPEIFKELGKKFLEFPDGLLDQGYWYNNERYWIKSERDYHGHYPVTFMMLLANYEYCDKEMIRTVLNGIDEYTIDRFFYFLLYVPRFTPENCDFKWQDYMINEEYGKKLDEVEMLYSECCESYNSDYFFEKILNYLEGNDDFRFQNTNSFVDYMMLEYCRRVYTDFGTNKFTEKYYREYYSKAEKQLEKQVEEIKNLLFNKVLTK